MPGLTSLPLNLSEILEARRGPLRELEIWALLCQCSMALQDLIIKGEAGGENAFRRMITPNTLLVRDNGTIQLAENVQSPQNSLYMAPEFETLSGHFISDAAFEKMFLYSLGRTLQVASEFGLQENEVLSISSDLDSLLQAMSERNAAVRLSLLQILEACCLQANQHPDKLPHSLVLSRVYKSILGGHHKRSFNDSNYGSDHSHEAVMTHQPGRARRPRPQVRHRHVRRKRASTSSTSSPNSRSRSRSRSPSRRTVKPSGSRSDLNAGEPGWSAHKGDSVAGAKVTIAPSALTSSQIMNTSMTSTSSELSLLARRQQAPPYSAAHSVQGLLGLRQGSPAYQKYIRLKERQIRRRQAKSGQAPSMLDDVRSRLMTPPLLSSEMLENMSESHSMASLMSYTLGAYKPYLHAELGSEAALNFNNETGPENDSQMSFFLSSMDYGYPSSIKAHAMPGAVAQDVSKSLFAPQAVPDVTSQEMAYGMTPGVAAEAPVPNQTLHMRQQPQATAASTDAAPAKIEYCAGKQRDFNGYEFAHNLRRPAVHVPMPLQGDSLKNATLARRVTVIHLSGQRFEIVLDPSSTARQLFDTVIPYLELDDFFFFGLTYVSEGEHFFLDADIKLHKVAPEGWKEGPKGHHAYTTFNLNVRVKFYPESLADFRHASSHHLLYLQLRRDVLEERVIVDADFLFKLAGLALQAEYGDYSKDKAASTEDQQGGAPPAPYFNAEHYIPGRVLKQTGPSNACTKVTRRHKATAGLSCAEAELEFVKLIQNHTEYGIHFHKLSKSKSQSEMIWIGLSQHNMTVAEPTVSAARSVTQFHGWNNILKISFNKRRFSVQPKVEGVRGKPPKINFYTNSYRKGRYLLQFSADQHRFEIRMKTRVNVAATPAGVAAMEAGLQVVEPEAKKVENSEVQTYVDPALQKLPDDDDDELDEDWDMQSKREDEQPPQYRSWPPYQLPRMVQILGGELSPLHASLTDLHNLGFDKHHLQALLDMSSATQGLDSVSANDNQKTGVSAPPPHLSLVTDVSPVGRSIFEVTLEKEEGHGVGITIVGGETTSSLDLGIFVKSVVSGGPAERDGRIRCGDRLIAIGATSLEGKQHHEAVAMIRDSGPSVTFLVSQVRPPGTIKRRNQSASEKVELEKKLRDSMLDYRHGNFDDPGGVDEFSRQDVDSDNINETLLRFDDFVSSQNVLSVSEDDEECHSDEENYPLDPPPTPPHLSLASASRKAGIQQHFQHSQPQHYRKSEQRVPSPPSPELDDPGFLAASTLESHLVPDIIDNPLKQPSAMQQSTSRLGDERELLKLQDDEDLARALVEESSEWPRDERLPSSIGYHSGPLTEEEQEDLQILGDLAALDADGSSSDSDFDSAIKKTIDAPNSMTYSGNKAVNTVSPLRFAAPESDEFLSNDVIYEVILEKDSNGCGIIAQPTPQDQEGGVYIKDIVHGSPADKGGFLVPGDKILEVAGQNVAGKDSRAVQELMDQAPNLTTVKVSRSMETDAAIMERKAQSAKLKSSHHKDNTHDNKRREEHEPNIPLPLLIPKAPTEITPPLEDLPIVPPPPPLNLRSDNSESNTQSDVDSDVLDSSRSDVDDFNRNTETFAIYAPVATATLLEKQYPVQDKYVTHHYPEEDKEWINGEDEKASRMENSSINSDVLKLDDSSEFDEKLNELKYELDRQLATENASPNSLSKSSGSSSTESIVKSPRKIIESLSSKSRQEDSDCEEDEEEEEEGTEGEKEHDDDEDVVVTMYGNEPVKAEPAAEPRKKKRKSKKPLEEEILDPFEPVLLDVSLKRQRDGFGFTVAGGVSTGGCYIKQLVSEPAMSDGRLRPGDKILQVNGHDTTSLGHVETVTLLRKLADVARLKLLRFPSTMETQQRVQAAQAQAQLASANPEPNQGELETSEESEVKVQAEQAAQELAKSPDTPKAIIHPFDYKGSLVEKADDVKDGDDPISDEPDGDVHGPNAEDFQVELTRPAGTHAVLGITLVQRDSEGQSLICVKRLKAGGLASRDGRLRRGDAILQVNGTPFTGLTVRQAVSYLREAGDTVLLSISRSEGGDASDGSGDESNHKDVQEPPQTVLNNDGDEDDDISALAEEAVSLLQDRPSSRVSSEQYDSFRKPLTDVPVVLSEEWINELPFMRMAVDESKEYSRTILQNLADLVESGEPNEAFKVIRQLKEAGPCTVGQSPENKPKNRYRNVLPYDANRIKLSGRGEDKEYINASLIEMPLVSYATNGEGQGDGEEDLTDGNDQSVSPGKCLKYFACQGPLESTVSDFWALLWQEQVHVVAMLTQTQEGGKLKCHPYWPRSKEGVVSVDNGTFFVRLMRSYSLQDIDVVQVTMEEPGTENKQEVILLQYKGWPDHGAPDTAMPLLKLLQVIHLLENGSPPVIHCSAGIGRTGALIAIDVALACIEHGVEFNLQNIVGKLRSQRYGMVQTTDQYLFCYTACMEALLSMDLT